MNFDDKFRNFEALKINACCQSEKANQKGG